MDIIWCDGREGGRWIVVFGNVCCLELIMNEFLFRGYVFFFLLCWGNLNFNKRLSCFLVVMVWWSEILNNLMIFIVL